MSTPSTASILQQPHHHYGFPHHHPEYHSRDTRPTSGFNSGPLIHPSAHSRFGSAAHYHSSANATSPTSLAQPERNSQTSYHHVSDINQSDATSENMASRKRRRTPNWSEFYKNGLPKEIIVIDDDSPQPTQHLPPARQTRQPRQTDAKPPPSSYAPEPASKKRKTTATNGHRSYPQQHTYDQQQYEEISSDSTRSSDRTESALHTTAATSLGSHYSQNASSSNSISYQPTKQVDAVVVKKRRTRQAVADEAKKLEAQRQGDAYASYVPPPKPPIKAKDVDVPVVQDVR